MKYIELQNKVKELKERVVELEIKVGLRHEWSAKAIENYGPDMSQLLSNTGDVEYWLQKAIDGIPMVDCVSFPDPNNSIASRKYIADIYMIEPSDIDLMILF